MRRRFRFSRGRLLATSLACAAFGANPAGAGPDNLIAAAMRTDDVHEHVAERFLDATGVAASVAHHLRLALIRRMIGDHVDQLFFTRPRQVGHWTIDRLSFHFGNFFQRQFRLAAIWRSGFLVSFDELAGEPAKHVIGNAGCVTNVWILGESARFKALISEFFHQTLQRYTVLERDRCERADRVH